MTKMTGGQALIGALEASGIDTIFGIPGVHTGAIYDALIDAKGIRHIMCRHEQGVGFMADGYYRVSGRPACALTITGPGVTNAATSLAGAQAESSAVLHVCTTLETNFVGRQVGALHELIDQSALIRAIVGWHRRIKRVSEIPEVIAEALHYMGSGPPRPASVEIPLDLLVAEEEVNVIAAQNQTMLGPDLKAVENASKILSETEVVILAGGGVIAAGACEELISLAERLCAPVITTVNGKGAIPESHPLYAGCRMRGDNRLDYLLAEAETVLVVGSQLSARFTDNWSMPLGKNVVQIDVDSQALGKHYSGVRGIHAHALPTLRELKRRVLPRPQGECENMHRKVAQLRSRLISMEGDKAQEIFSAIRSQLPDNAAVFNDMTTLCYEVPMKFPVERPKTVFFPSYLGTLGFSVPAAMGAKVAAPERPILALCGDGGFLFTVQELATAVAERIGIVIIIFNDNGYMELEPFFERDHGRSFDCSLTNPDFVSLAQAFGITGTRVVNPDELASVLKKSLRSDEVSLIEYCIS